MLTLSGKPEKLEGTVRPDQKKADETKLKLVGLRDARFGCTFDGEKLGQPGMVQLSAVISAAPGGQATWAGEVHWPNGTKAPIQVAPAEGQAQ